MAKHQIIPNDASKPIVQINSHGTAKKRNKERQRRRNNVLAPNPFAGKPRYTPVSVHVTDDEYREFVRKQDPAHGGPGGPFA